MKTKLIFIALLSFNFCLLSSQVPQGFNYQAIATDAGSPIVTPITVRFTIQATESGGETFWIEDHLAVTPNAQGLFTRVVGTGVKVTGSTANTFADIDWRVTPKWIKTEINYSGWKTMGATLLQSAPYSMVSQNLSGSIDRLVVTGKSASYKDALFEVKNNNNQTIFAVYNEGVRVFIDNGLAKSPKGGFAIGSFGTDDKGKTESQRLLFVKSDTIRMYIDDRAKVPKGGFAIGGFGEAKNQNDNYLKVDLDIVKAGKIPYFNLNPINSFIGEQAGLANTTGQFNSFMGYKAGFSNEGGSSNVFIGNESGKTNIGGANNVFLGFNSGFTNSGGNNNTFLGHVAGKMNSSGSNNVFLGDSAGFNNIDGDQNIFLGNGSGKENGGDFNAFIGYQSGRHNSTGQNNAFIGYQSGYNNLTANNNAFIGYQSGWRTWKGSKNVFIGYQAGFNNYGIQDGPTYAGNNNIYIGDQSAYYNTTGRSNVYIGHNAGYGSNPIYGSDPPRFNVYIGYQAGYKEYRGRNNTFIGYQSGFENLNGSYLTFIGEQAGNKHTDGHYSTFIGYLAGALHQNGASDLFIGAEAGFNNLVGVGNVFIGPQSGYYETGNNKLFIDNQSRTNETTSRTSSLIYGEFNATVASQVLRINGKVGVMLAANPTEALEVNGNVKATTFIATLGAAGAYKYGTTTNLILPDYVFDKHFDGKSTVNPVYEMLNLSDLRRYVTANHHLPRVPSRDEIEKDGAVNLQGLSMITLEKVEENTLYILELESKMTDQQKQMKEQQEIIDALLLQNHEKEKRIKALESSIVQINILKKQMEELQAENK